MRADMDGSRDAANWGSLRALGSEMDPSWIGPVMRRTQSALLESDSANESRLLAKTSGAARMLD